MQRLQHYIEICQMYVILILTYTITYSLLKCHNHAALPLECNIIDGSIVF